MPFFSIPRKKILDAIVLINKRYLDLDVDLYSSNI